MSTIIEIDGRRYAIPTDAQSEPIARFALPDGRTVRVLSWIETFPAQVERFEVATALPCAVPLTSAGGGQ